MNYRFLLDMALILLGTKVAGILFRKMGLPQVLGSLIVGVLYGVLKIITPSVELDMFSEIGVILIMFTAGMETNFDELKKNAVPSVIITSLGVIVPFLLGFAVAFMIPDITLKMRMFFGVILMATSVGITVATLKEIGVLQGKVGSSVVTAAVLDDIIGVVVLAFFTAEAGETTLAARIFGLFNADINALSSLVVLINVVLFFVIAVGFGLGVHYLFKYMANRWPHTRRLSIFSLGMCFLYAWAAEELFGIAAITGAFLAGMMIAKSSQTPYVERRVDMAAYMIFSPMFFVNIGVSLPYDVLVDSFSWLVVGFSALFIFVGLLSKFIGAGLGAKLCKYSYSDSAKIGIAMMVRGEVCLIIANEGVSVGIMSQQYYPAIVMLIIISSILTPIFLKLLFKKFPQQDESHLPLEPSYAINFALEKHEMHDEPTCPCENAENCKINDENNQP